MQADVLALLCDPQTHEPLEIKTEPAGANRLAEFLVHTLSGRRFPIRDGILIFVDNAEIEGSNKKYQTLYNRFAPFYDVSTSLYARFTGKSVQARLREYLDELEIKANDKVLEISVGTGRNLRYLPRSARYFGLDLSWGMLKRCQGNSARWKLDVALCLGTAEQLPYRDSAFDVVFHVGGINYFNDNRAAIAEMIRVAKPNTKMIVVDETERLAQRYAKTPGAEAFYASRSEVIAAPVDLVPTTMQETQVKTIANGDLYCLSFRKPR